MTMTDDDEARRTRNADAFRDMLAKFSAGDKYGQLAHIADDIVYSAPYYPTMEARRGKDAMEAMLTAVEDRFTEIYYGVEEIFPTLDPDLVIAEVRGNHQVKDSPNRYQNHYIMFVRFNPDGLVYDWREFSNPNVYSSATGE
jgi:ketosteroid isomerase-like protein